MTTKRQHAAQIRASNLQYEPPEIPPKRGRPAKAKTIGGGFVMAALDERARILAAKSAKRRTLTFKIRDSDYSRVVALAEQHDEDIPTIVRACLLHGLRHYEEWASNGATISPFDEGALPRRPPSHYDPIGVNPSYPRMQPFLKPEFVQVGHPLPLPTVVTQVPGMPSGASEPVGHPRPVTEEIVEETDFPMFSPVEDSSA